MKYASIVKISFFVILVALLLMACQSTPVAYVNSFEKFVERVERNAPSFSIEQWEENDGQLQTIIEKYHCCPLKNQNSSLKLL